MKRIILIGMVLLALLGCSVDVKEGLVSPVLDPQAQQAMLLAQQEVVSISSDERSGGWSRSSTVVNAFPLYLDGIDEISYYECKVMTNGEDSGYVLVNVNDTDFPVVEAQEYGLTVNETFEEMTGLSKEELIICRYSYTANAAFMKKDKTDSTLRSRGANASPIATIGFIFMVDDFDYDQYRTEVKVKGGSLFSTVEPVSKNDTVLLGMTGKGNAEVALQYKWFNGQATPAWDEFDRIYGNKVSAVGGGAIAHAIVLAYWEENRNRGVLEEEKKALFRTTDLSSPVSTGVKTDVIIMSEFIRTTPVAGGQGYTSPSNMARIQDYITARGYPYSTVTRRNGGYDSKFNMIHDSLIEDRPVIMGINSGGIGALSHYVVVEHARRQSRVGSNFIRYYSNFGWGGIYKWVYAYGRGSGGDRHSTYDIWDVNISFRK